MTVVRTEASPATALVRARDHLLALQSPEGWWKGELETNVTMDAEDMFTREFLGIRTDEQTRATAAWIRSQQREDGTWANFYGGPGDLSTTIEAYVALRLAGDSSELPHMRAASAFVREQGGLEHARVFTKMWLSLFGLWRWEDAPVLPPELVFLPKWVPLNLYDFACWARQTIGALAVVCAFKPSRPRPFEIPELLTGRHPPRAEDGWSRAFFALDRLLHRYERGPIRPLRRRALARLERWIVDHQEADGSWGGIQPPWVWSLIALHLLGYPLDHPVMEKGLRGLDGFTIVENGTRRLEACQSPVWDTVLAMIALSDAGLPPDHEALVRAAHWVVREEITTRGDWAVRRPKLAPGGWAFEFANDWYPDIDDTAEVVLALRRVAPEPAIEAAVQRAVSWTLGMRSKDGAWGAFDADNVRALCRKLPFCDFGEVIDPPSADVTAHVVEMLAAEGLGHQRAVDWLLREQEPDGSWFGRWGANYVYGTGAVVPALVAAGVSPEHESIQRAVAWLESVQNEDGGWGEDLRSYDDQAWRGRGASTASQTAWALLALHAAGVGSTEPVNSGGAGFAGAGAKAAERGEAVERGIAWLAETQLPDGTWDEPWYTGTGFPGDFYINYHLYRLVFPVMALGRLVR